MGTTSKRPTIYDVAREAGVSANTVSRVINGKSGVGDATRLRIHQVIDTLGYHPHMGARALRGHQGRCVGVVQAARPDDMPLSHFFMVWLLGELQQVFGEAGERICFDMNPLAGCRVSTRAKCLGEPFLGLRDRSPLPLGDRVIERLHASAYPPRIREAGHLSRVQRGDGGLRAAPLPVRNTW